MRRCVIREEVMIKGASLALFDGRSEGDAPSLSDTL